MIKGEILLKGDKSVTHRVIMISSLFEYDVKIYNPSACLDIASTINVLNKCGAVIYYVNNNGQQQQPMMIQGTVMQAPKQQQAMVIMQQQQQQQQPIVQAMAQPMAVNNNSSFDC